MGSSQSIQKINYIDMQMSIKNRDLYLIINTLPVLEQSCLIVNTIPIEQEEQIINKYLTENKNIRIIIYGKNCNDDTVQKKYNQLYSLGFYQLYVYNGGLFEWLLLQDIYGFELFPTNNNNRIVDILKYKSPTTLNFALLEY
jgi:hypothetical protein